MIGISICQANNGSWIVTDFTERGSGYVPVVLAACTNDDDLRKYIDSWLGGVADARLAIARSKEQKV